MGHGRFVGCAMPVPLVRLEPDDVAGPDDLFRLAFTLRPSLTRGDQQCLAKRMGMPGGSRTRSNVTVAPPVRAGASVLNG